MESRQKLHQKTLGSVYDSEDVQILLKMPGRKLFIEWKSTNICYITAYFWFLKNSFSSTKSESMTKEDLVHK